MKPISNSKPVEWDLTDVVDLEVALWLEQAEDAAESRARAREAYQRVRQDQSADQVDRRVVFKEWLEERRPRLRGETGTPGEVVAGSLATIRFVGGLLLFLGGTTGCMGALKLGSGQFVNMTYFVPLTVFLPLLFTVYGFWVLMAGRFHLPELPVALRGLLYKMTRWGLKRAVNPLRDALGAAGNLRMDALLGSLRQRIFGHQNILRVEISRLLHGLGLALIAGVFVGALMFKIFDEQEYGYGWKTQSAVVTPERLARVIHVLAMPWAWAMGEGMGYPSVEQVRDSRFSGPSGRMVQSPALKQCWSAFLVWGIFVYAFLPRLGLWLVGVIAKRHALRAERFSENRFEELWLRMSRPDATIRGPVQKDGKLELPVGAEACAPSGDAILVVPTDLRDSFSEVEIKAALERARALRVIAVEELPGLPNAQQVLLGKLRSARVKAIVVLQMAEYPAQGEFLDFLEAAQSSTAAETGVYVCLVEGSSARGFGRDNTVIWRSKVAALGHAKISVFNLVLTERIDP